MRSMGFGGMAQPMSRGKLKCPGFCPICNVRVLSDINLILDMLCITQVREKMAEQWDQDILRNGSSIIINSPWIVEFWMEQTLFNRV